MKTNLSIWLVGMLSFAFYACQSQQAAIQNVSSTEAAQRLDSIEALYVAVDKLDNIYAIDQLQRLVKFNEKGQKTYDYFNRNLGRPGYLDVTNPLQILLYFPDFQIIKTLDNTLAETGTFDLTNLDLLECEAVGLANDNTVWIYDDNSTQLKKIDILGNVRAQSERMDLMLFGQTIRPTQIIERNNLVYVFDPEKGLLLFDNFAQLIRFMDQIKGGSIQVYQTQIIHTSDDGVVFWDMDQLQSSSYTVPETAFPNDQLIFLGKDRWLIRRGSNLKIIN